AAGFIDAALAVRVQSDADIEVRQDIMRCQPVEKMTAFDAVHAAEHHVALRDGLHGGRRHQIRVDDFDLRPEAHGCDGTGHRFDLGTLEVSVFAPRIHDAIEIELFNEIGVDEHEPTETEARELFDERTAGPGAA